MAYQTRTFKKMHILKPYDRKQRQQITSIQLCTSADYFCIQMIPLIIIKILKMASHCIVYSIVPLSLCRFKFHLVFNTLASSSTPCFLHCILHEYFNTALAFQGSVTKSICESCHAISGQLCTYKARYVHCCIYLKSTG